MDVDDPRTAEVRDCDDDIIACDGGFEHDQLEMLRTAFLGLGPDTDGRINRGQLHAVLTDHGLSPDEHEFAALWAGMDRDNDGKVDFPEFATGLALFVASKATTGTQGAELGEEDDALCASPPGSPHTAQEPPTPFLTPAGRPANPEPLDFCSEGEGSWANQAIQELEARNRELEHKTTQMQRCLEERLEGERADMAASVSALEETLARALVQIRELTAGQRYGPCYRRLAPTKVVATGRHSQHCNARAHACARSLVQVPRIESPASCCGLGGVRVVTCGAPSTQSHTRSAVRLHSAQLRRGLLVHRFVCAAMSANGVCARKWCRARMCVHACMKVTGVGWFPSVACRSMRELLPQREPTLPPKGEAIAVSEEITNAFVRDETRALYAARVQVAIASALTLALLFARTLSSPLEPREP